MKHNIYKHKTQSLIYQVRSHYCVAGLMRTRKVQSKPRSVLQSEPIQRPAQQKVTSTPSANAPNALRAAKVLKPNFLQVANLKVEKSYYFLQKQNIYVLYKLGKNQPASTTAIRRRLTFLKHITRIIMRTSQTTNQITRYISHFPKLLEHSSDIIVLCYR